MRKLDAALPPIWSHANPADIAGDADAERYAVALEYLLEDDANDAVLVMNVPTALASAADAAKSVIAVTERQRKKHAPAKPVFTMWMGENGPASEAFEAAGIANYATNPRQSTASCISCIPRNPRCLDGDAAKSSRKISRPMPPPCVRSSMACCEKNAPGSIRSS